jgi:hypothetical protein
MVTVIGEHRFELKDGLPQPANANCIDETTAGPVLFADFDDLDLSDHLPGLRGRHYGLKVFETLLAIRSTQAASPRGVRRYALGSGSNDKKKPRSLWRECGASTAHRGA